MTDIYQTLKDGRVIELRLGWQTNLNHAIWARNLNTNEKKIYFQLKGRGYSDLRIYKQLNSDGI